MRHAIEILEKELSTPQRSSNAQDDPDEEDDMAGAVLSFRRTLDLKLAIKHLKYMQEASNEISKTL